MAVVQSDRVDINTLLFSDGEPHNGARQAVYENSYAFTKWLLRQ